MLNFMSDFLQRLWNLLSRQRSIDIATILCLCFSAFLVYSQSILSIPPEWLNRLDFLYYDLRFEEMPIKREDSLHKVVILDIDDASIMQEGRWPWPRQKLADLTASAFDAGAVVVSYDIVYSEAQQNIVEVLSDHVDNPQLQQELSEYMTQFDGDLALREAMSMGDVVLGYFTQSNDQFRVNDLPSPLIVLDGLVNKTFVAQPEEGWTANLPMFKEVSAREGFVTAFPDSDGTVRRSPLMVKIGNGLYPSMAFSAVLEYLLAEEAPEVKLEDYGEIAAVRAIKIGEFWINTDIMMQVLVPYRGAKHSYPYVSATALMHGDEDARAMIQDAIVLVGTSAAGLYDMRSTPLDEVYPGVEVHANLIDGMLQGAIPYRPDWERGASMVILVVIGILFSLLFPRLNPMTLLLAGIITIASILGVNNYLWVVKMMELPVSSQVLLVAGIMMISMAQGFLSEAATRQRIKAIFDQYVPPQHVNTMLKDPDSINLDGESRNMTMFFMDIRGFTTISETLDAAQLKRFLSRIFTPVTHAIFDHHGTIDKYVGDMVMAFWGAPLPDKNHSLHSVETALEISKIMQNVREVLDSEGMPRPYVGMGINSGLVNVGDMGSEVRRAYTVIGDPVNLASRIEGLTKFYGVEILVGESTYLATKDSFIWREMDLIRAKGKTEAVGIYQPLGRPEDMTPQLSEQQGFYHAARQCYLKRDWVGAKQMFDSLVQDDQDCLIFKIYSQRCEEFMAVPPPDDWLGEFTHTSK